MKQTWRKHCSVRLWIICLWNQKSQYWIKLQCSYTVAYRALFVEPRTTFHSEKNANKNHSRSGNI